MYALFAHFLSHNLKFIMHDKTVIKVMDSSLKCYDIFVDHIMTIPHPPPTTTWSEEETNFFACQIRRDFIPFSTDDFFYTKQSILKFN